MPIAPRYMVTRLSSPASFSFPLFLFFSSSLPLPPFYPSDRERFPTRDSTPDRRETCYMLYLTPIFPSVLDLPAADRNRPACFAKHDSSPRWNTRLFIPSSHCTRLVSVCQQQPRFTSLSFQYLSADRRSRALNGPNRFRNGTFADSPVFIWLDGISGYYR